MHRFSLFLRNHALTEDFMTFSIHLLHNRIINRRMQQIYYDILIIINPHFKQTKPSISLVL